MGVRLGVPASADAAGRNHKKLLCGLCGKPARFVMCSPQPEVEGQAAGVVAGRLESFPQKLRRQPLEPCGEEREVPAHQQRADGDQHAARNLGDEGHVPAVLLEPR